MGQQSLSGNFDKLLVSGEIAQIPILSSGQSRFMKPQQSIIVKKFHLQALTYIKYQICGAKAKKLVITIIQASPSWTSQANLGLP